MSEAEVGDFAVTADEVEISPSCSASLPLSSNGEPPLIVTLAPKATAAEKVLTDEEVDLLRTALVTKSVDQVAQAVRSIKPLAFEIRKQSNQMSNSGRSKAARRHLSGGEASREGREAAAVPSTVKKRAVRAQPIERRRPWKPERLDPTKPILQCDACGYQANRRDYMRRHQIRVHSDYRPYQCTLCDFKTTEKHDLDRHMNSKYHGGKGMSQKRQKLTATVRIKCDQCNYSSKSVNSILRHKQTHRIAHSQQLYEEELQQDDGGEPMDVPEEAVELATDPHPDAVAVAADNTESLDATDPVTVLMMNDLMAQAQGAGD